MTRRGSLVYYLAAWALACFFMSLSVWIKDRHGATVDSSAGRVAVGLLFFCFYGLVFGAFTALAGAFLLRRLAARLRCKTPSHWALFGAILAPGLVGFLGALGRHISNRARSSTGLLSLVTFGPKTVLEAGWWLAIPAGALTAYFLCRIHRAFAAQEPAKSA